MAKLTGRPKGARVTRCSCGRIRAFIPGVKTVCRSCKAVLTLTPEKEKKKK